MQAVLARAFYISGSNAAMAHILRRNVCKQFRATMFEDCASAAASRGLVSLLEPLGKTRTKMRAFFIAIGQGKSTSRKSIFIHLKPLHLKVFVPIHRIRQKVASCVRFSCDPRWQLTQPDPGVKNTGGGCHFSFQ